MSRGGSLDTNVILRLILGDIPEQAEAAQKLLQKYDWFGIADIALIEVIFALERYYEIPRKEIVETLSAFQGNLKFNFNRKLFEEAGTIYENHPKLSIEDCCLVTYAKLNEATPLWTFDEKLAKQTDSAAKVIL